MKHGKLMTAVFKLSKIAGRDIKIKSADYSLVSTTTYLNKFVRYSLNSSCKLLKNNN